VGGGLGGSVVLVSGPVGTLLLILAALIVWLLIRVQPLLGKPHLERLDRFHSSLAADREKVVICLGDSLTHGNASFDYVHALALRLEPWGYTILNAGVNGELAWNLLQRAEDVVSVEPAFVVLLVGTNDARGSEDERAGARYVRRQALPQAPDEDFFFDNYRLLLDKLETSETARTVLVTLPPLGERRGEPIDEVLDRFNEFIENEAQEREMACLPLGRVLHERLLSDAFEDTPAYEAQGAERLVLKSLFRHYLLGWSWDRISSHFQMKLLTDMIHLNEASGSTLVDLIEAEIKVESESE